MGRDVLPGETMMLKMCSLAKGLHPSCPPQRRARTWLSEERPGQGLVSAPAVPLQLQGLGQTLRFKQNSIMIIIIFRSFLSGTLYSRLRPCGVVQPSAFSANPQISPKSAEQGRWKEGNPRTLPWDTALRYNALLEGGRVPWSPAKARRAAAALPEAAAHTPSARAPAVPRAESKPPAAGLRTGSSAPSDSSGAPFLAELSPPAEEHGQPAPRLSAPATGCSRTGARSFAT